MNDIGKERWLALGETMGWVQGDAPPVPLPGIAIANRAALDAALAGATGGEIFRLADDDFGSLEIKRQWADPVTIIGGTFGSVKLGTPHWKARGKGVVLQHVKATYLEAKAFDAATFLHCEAEQLLIESADGATVERCWLHDGHFPLRLLRATNFRVIGNIMERAREDTMRISGDSHDGEVRGNVFLDNRAAKPMHGDHLQIFGLPKEATGPKHIVIEQNLMHDDATDKEVTVLATGRAGTAAPAQGVFIGDGAGDFTDFSIRHNLIRLSMVNAIAAKSAPERFTVAENIVLPVKGFNVARIRFGKHDDQPHWTPRGATVSRNVTTMIEDSSG
ncbi:right-handed parallel beta-helix repeat-containing protein, partial [Falsirhodobacter xinxiangensis]|uniref:right-handed parallel beta-helix repeat-containing protein n=1 Tax=Falsirhodobacter xinxiangensis TaxID=2530049 RepID=UPI0010AAB1B5